MKIVIELDEKVYGLLKYFEKSLGLDDKKDGEDVKTALMRAVIHGTPLPEHHGRLIDISEYEKYFNTAITYDDGNHNHTVYTNMIPTIIEADRGE